jgi:hypothetical protein
MNSKTLLLADDSRITYAEVCAALGMDPSEHFVKITNRQTISFTSGHPNEIVALLVRCYAQGFIPSAKLIAAAKRRS